jgi:hypothetical protein
MNTINFRCKVKVNLILLDWKVNISETYRILSFQKDSIS